MRPELPPAVFTAPPTGWRVWWTAARPRTLSIAATPVLVGTALALAEGAAPVWFAMFAALCCAVFIQVGTNLHNDAADFERGTDQPDRIGPLRVTAAGWVSPAAVRRAAAISFALALVLGFYLVRVGGWPILANARVPWRMTRGAWRFRQLQGYTSRGCGVSGVECRYSCPPEIVLHQLHRAPGRA